MTESTSYKLQVFVEAREEEHLEREKESMKRKHKDFEEMECNAIRLLYNDTLEESDSVKSSTPKKVNAIRLLYNDTPEESDRIKSSTPKKVNAIRLLYNDTPEESDSVKSSTPKKVKPFPFSKVWRDEDEISILKGMIKFKDETGWDAGQNMVEFRAFILGSLALQATLIQLREKVKRLKDKYEKNVERGNEAKTPHEVEVFQLCQKIWTQQHKSSGTEQPQQQNILVKEKHNILEKGLPVKEKLNIPEKGLPKHNILESGQSNIDRARQLMVDKHKIIPATGVNWETMNALWKRVSDDLELVVNSKPCLSENQKEVQSQVINLCFQSTNLNIKLGKFVVEKSVSSELGDFPELLEQEVLRAYLEAKVEHA